MIRLGWKQRLHTFFAGRMLGCEFLADEGYVTQMLEMGQRAAVADFDQDIQDVWIYR
ncbi:MAG: hypothetical protein K0R47_5743 [Brevibacillus sp.]|nr:hypothetical protein [Brevibacillus sp.]